MKNLIFTLTITTLTILAAQAETSLMPSDTVREKASKKYIFENETTTFSNLLSVEALVEEPSRKMTMNNLKPLPSDYSGYKLEVARVYYKPLEDNDAIFENYETVMIEKVGDNIYVYLIGEFKSERAAQKYIETLKEKQTYTLVKYKNGLRVDIK